MAAAVLSVIPLPIAVRDLQTAVVAVDHLVLPVVHKVRTDKPVGKMVILLAHPAVTAVLDKDRVIPAGQEMVDQDVVDQDVVDQEMLDQADREIVDQADQDMAVRVDQEMAARADQEIADQADQDMVVMVDQEMVDQADRDMVDRADQEIADQVDQDMGTVVGTTLLRRRKLHRIRHRIRRPRPWPIHQQSLALFSLLRSGRSCHHIRSAI
jgi:hypothetical protein